MFGYISGKVQKRKEKLYFLQKKRPARASFVFRTFLGDYCLRLAPVTTRAAALRQDRAIQRIDRLPV